MYNKFKIGDIVKLRKEYNYLRHNSVIINKFIITQIDYNNIYSLNIRNMLYYPEIYTLTNFITKKEMIFIYSYHIELFYNLKNKRKFIKLNIGN
jgi:hypothetical protein